MREEYIKFISFDFNPNNINEPIKATNYKNPNFEYKSAELWPAFLNYYPISCSGCISKEFEPLQAYIIDKYNAGESIHKILHRLTSSYFNTLDEYHENLILESVEYGHITNRTRHLNSGDSMYTKMLKFFARLIYEPVYGKATGMFDNPKCFKIVKENKDLIWDLKNAAI